METGAAVAAVQHVGVEVPITLSPETRLGALRAECCGAPAVLACRVYRTTAGMSCVLRVEQTLRVDLPLEFGVCATMGDPNIRCC
jgi:hypothetical protein